MSNTMSPRERREPELTLAELCGNSARMAPHWVVPAVDAPGRVPPSAIHGVVVPPASARMMDAASEYGG
ncbi:hypothetical protein BJP40_03120 [Streptomyces sp. CC53]|uniref:hypothetical protein n=1 Tax=unclassified Streptomyces TaxID=2593676 RepID=UPI0008DDBFC8|nr:MULTISPECIES: hypothetical protein [unclassified Streptomyces]OII62809.1 hypothetical protein BJP40_03120 [Streptomyces sp. CC53]